MFLNSWAIALTLVSVLSCFLIIMAGKTAIRVLMFWDLDSDSSTQIKLEGEIWLSSTLVMYGACFQIISLVLLIFATDQFAEFIAGAMCATGSLLANEYGMPLLYVKLGSSFMAGLWIVVHKLDISSEEYPLVRFKYVMLLLLTPLLLCELYLQCNYILNLTPDIITSCCAVVFDTGQKGVMFTGIMDSPLPLFYWSFAGLVILSLVCRYSGWKSLIVLYGVAMGCFLMLAIDTLITTLSSYIYAMPYHKCPFCIIKPEYHFIGFFIYLMLFGSVFYGVSAAFIQIFSKRECLEQAVVQAQKLYLRCSTVMLVLFVVSSSYHFWVYRFFGGE
jgi:hypothetical protein